jgi:hypothetical protein
MVEQKINFLRPFWQAQLNVEKSEGVDLMTGVNRPAGQQIGEQHSSVPTHTPEPEKTSHVGLDHDLGGLGLGLGH